MAGRPAKAKKKTVAKETSASIAEQTKAFLEGGGKIEQIEKGSSGRQETTGRRHIVISSNPRR